MTEMTPYPGRRVALGELSVIRTLPARGRRLVGPWCFLDRFGPLAFRDGKPMDVGPHPHIGLQTVSWLLEGELVHDDSLGSHAVLRPGGVNVMTAGRGIAHTEQTPAAHSGHLDGVQLWVALPDRVRHDEPSFCHLGTVPVRDAPGGQMQVFMGTLDGLTSPAPAHSALVGAELALHPGGRVTLALDPSWEHAVVLLGGDAAVDQVPLETDALGYLDIGRAGLTVSSQMGGRVLLIGGAPFPEPVLMWWNFVARTPDEIRQARQDWESGTRFGDVAAYPGPRMTAPVLSRLAEPNPAS